MPWAPAFEAAVYFYAAAGVFIYMLADDEVTLDEYFALGAAFTLLAWGSLHVFVVVQPRSRQLHREHAPRRSQDVTELLFLSFSTLSATDSPTSFPCVGTHAASTCSSGSGVFYIAMVVTRLISLAVRRGSVRGDSRAR